MNSEHNFFQLLLDDEPCDREPAHIPLKWRHVGVASTFIMINGIV